MRLKLASDPQKEIQLQTDLASVLHHIEDAEHTTDPEYKSGSIDDAEEAAEKAMSRLSPDIAGETLKEHLEEELTEPEHEEPHEKSENGGEDEEKRHAMQYIDVLSKTASATLYRLLQKRAGEPPDLPSPIADYVVNSGPKKSPRFRLSPEQVARIQGRR